jgi:toxin CcdB
LNQYDVFDNPAPRARKAFPFVVILQHKFADTGRQRLVAPLTPRSQVLGTTGRLTPVVKVTGVEHVLIVPRMSPTSATQRRAVRDQLAAEQNAITSGLDLLFLGI